MNARRQRCFLTSAAACGVLRVGFIVLALCAGFSAEGLTNTATWWARSWQSEDGLPDNTVTGLAQTEDGYLWLGTPSGLARFDGLRFEEFSPTNFIGAPNRGIIAMAPGRRGALWLAMDRGAVVRLESKGSRVYTAGLPDSIPNGLAEDAEGGLWVAYRGGAVYHLKEGRTRALSVQDGLPQGTDICALATGQDGRVWFAKEGQLGVVTNGSFQTLHRFQTPSARLAGSRQGGVWLCTGLRLYKIGGSGQVEDRGDFKPEHGGTVATALLEDGEGVVWIGTSFSGLYRYDDTSFTSVPTSQQQVLSLVEDREGNLWAGTQGGGLNRIRRRAITLEGPESGLPYPAVQSICQDTEGTVWAATQNGMLARRFAGKWIALQAAEQWPTDVTCVTSDPAGGVWLGTRLHGLYRWQNGRLQNWSKADGIRGQTLHTLLVSRAGDLWIGEENPHCVQRLRRGVLTTYDAPADSRVIRAMTEDAAGNIWAGTSKGVLFRVSGDQLEEVRARSSKELASIRCLYGTPDGVVWIGYAGWGVGRLHKGGYTEVRSSHGLHDDYISHIVSDTHGWLWFGGNRGIFKVLEEDFEAVARGLSARVRSIHYARGEGLPSLQGTFGDSPNVLRGHDGRLWIPMRTALAVVDPAKLADALEAPPTLLHRVTVDDRTVGWYGGILSSGHNQFTDLGSADARVRLAPGHRRLEFQFSAPSFTAPESIQFRYRLEGLDQDWRDAGTSRSASYSRLPAGNYLFRVVSCNNDGSWDSPPAVLSLVVTPFFYQSWWFRLGALCVFALGLVATVRYVSFRRLHHRLRLLESQAALHKEQVRIAKDIHDDVGANLTQIALLGELARQDRNSPQKAEQSIEKISAAARQAIKSLDEIVWAVNPHNDTLAHLIDYTGQYALDYLRVAGVRCRLDLPDQPPSREVSTDIRHNLFLIVKESLNNIVKHAHATEVWLRVQSSSASLRIEVEDNGCGFHQGSPGEGADGLRNIRQRALEIGGQCTIESQPTQGTRVTVELPWPANSGTTQAT